MALYPTLEREEEYEISNSMKRATYERHHLGSDLEAEKWKTQDSSRI